MSSCNSLWIIVNFMTSFYQVCLYKLVTQGLLWHHNGYNGVAKQSGHVTQCLQWLCSLNLDSWEAVWLGKDSYFKVNFVVPWQNRNWYLVFGHGCETTDSQMSPQPRLRLGCGDIWESVVSQPWPQTRYQFLQPLSEPVFTFHQRHSSENNFTKIADELNP